MIVYILKIYQINNAKYIIVILFTFVQFYYIETIHFSLIYKDEFCDNYS